MRGVLFFVSMALVAGVIAGITALLFWNVINVQIPYCLRIFLPSSTGLCVALMIEGVLRGESWKSILLRKVIPALIGLSIAYYFICVARL